MSVCNVKKLSQLYQPISSTIYTAKKLQVVSKSHENLVKYGLIQQIANGLYAMLPMGLRVLNKLTDIVDTEMERIGAQKLSLPSLIPTQLWEKTDRHNSTTELFKIKDRSHKDYILGPTFEETICLMLSKNAKIMSQNILPLKLYQISSKWRDEIKPRHGFLKSREFIMKDLYTFDKDLISAQDTYASVCEAYTKIFNKIGIPFIKAIGNPGIMGGSVTHEYHYMCEIGEDTVCTCSSCQHVINKSICKETHCPKCKNAFREEQTIEVGHAFLLNAKYTIPLNVTTQINNVSTPLVMSCFGLGLTRIFTAITEILSTDKELRWPKNLAPYTICIIPPKKGSKEESRSQYTNQVIEILTQLNIDTILDDRTNLTIGNRLLHARMTGFPYVIILGKSIIKSPPLLEIHNINNSTNCEISVDNVSTYFNNENIKI